MKFNRFSHIYRYAKNWYKMSENRMDDLKKIFKYTYGHDYNSENDIISVLSSITFEHIQKSDNPEYNFDKLINTLNPDSFENKLYGRKDQSFNDRFLNASLSIIGLCKAVKINGELEEPNENILPLSESAIKNKQEEK